MHRDTDRALDFPPHENTGSNNVLFCCTRRYTAVQEVDLFLPRVRAARCVAKPILYLCFLASFLKGSVCALLIFLLS